MSRVTVVIPTFNRAALAARAVESALAQTVAARCDVVLVDDGSTDDTPALAARFRGRIRYLRQCNAGPAAARNAAIRAVPNEFVAFLDSDDQWAPSKLSRQLDALERHTQAGFVACRGALRDDSGREWSPAWPDLPRGVPLDLTPALFERVFLPTSTLLVRRAALLQAGLFPEAVRRCEDYRLLVRLASRYAGILLDEPLVTCEWGAPAALSTATQRVLAAEIAARYAFAGDRTCRGANRTAWRRGLADKLAARRDAHWRAGDYAAAARDALRVVALEPLTRARWEWGRCARSILRALARV